MPPANFQKIVIFLDVDGVLLPVSPMCFGGGDIETVCVQRLKAIVDACGGTSHTTIVISSTWRHDEEKKKRLNAAFAQVGGIPSATRGVPDGVRNPTTVTYLKKNLSEQKLVRDRVDEIYEWMEVNSDDFPEAKLGSRWFAIDDMDLGVDERMKGHFLKTDTEEGLLQSDVATAVRLITSLPEYIPAPPPPPPPQVPVILTGPGHSKKPVPALPTELLPDVEYHGSVKRYNPFRGFGFITAANGEELFVHQSAIAHHGFRGLNEREPVAFFVCFDEPIAVPSSSGPEALPICTKKAIRVRQLTAYIPAVVPHGVHPMDIILPPHVHVDPIFTGLTFPAPSPYNGNGFRAPNGCVYYSTPAPPPPPSNFRSSRGGKRPPYTPAEQQGDAKK